MLFSPYILSNLDARSVSSVEASPRFELLHLAFVYTRPERPLSFNNRSIVGCQDGSGPNHAEFKASKENIR